MSYETIYGLPVEAVKGHEGEYRHFFAIGLQAGTLPERVTLYQMQAFSCGLLMRLTCLKMPMWS